jgi:hypothetical protein
MRVVEACEVLSLSLMQRGATTASPDKLQALLDNVPTRNSAARR